MWWRWLVSQHPNRFIHFVALPGKLGSRTKEVPSWHTIRDWRGAYYHGIVYVERLRCIDDYAIGNI